MAAPSGLALDITTGSGVAIAGTFTEIASIVITRNSASSTGWYVDYTANMYATQALANAGSEPLDSFRWRLEHDTSVRDSVTGIAIGDLKLQTSLTGTSLLSGTKSRAYDMTTAADVA